MVPAMDDKNILSRLEALEKVVAPQSATTMKSLRITSIPWLILAAGCLLIASIAGYDAIKAANEFIEMVTSKEDGLLFQFSFSAVVASFSPAITVTMLGLAWQSRESLPPKPLKEPNSSSGLPNEDEQI